MVSENQEMVMEVMDKYVVNSVGNLYLVGSPALFTTSLSPPPPPPDPSPYWSIGSPVLGWCFL